MSHSQVSARYQKSAGSVRPAWRAWLGALLLAGTAPVLAQEGSLRLASLSPQMQPAQRNADSALSAAREAFQKKDWKALPGLVESARDAELGMYAEYWMLRYLLTEQRTIDPTLLQAFVDRYPGTYLADKLKGDWVLAAARAGDFAQVRRVGDVQVGSPQVSCAQLDARYRGGESVRDLDAVAVFAPGNACWALFDKLSADKVLDRSTLVLMWRDLLDENKLAHARRMASYVLNPAELKEYDAALKNPMQWLSRQEQRLRTPAQRDIATVALSRLARKNMEDGDAYLRRAWNGRLPEEDLKWVRSQFALVAALNLNPVAHRWYQEADGVRLTEYNAAWRVRAALRQPEIDWGWVSRSIAQMTPSQRNESVWVYWNARSLKARGQETAANDAFASIAGEYGFYGQLAAEELGFAIAPPPAPARVTAAELADVAANPGLRRSIALFREGWRAEAVPEWNFALRGMNDRQLLAAAELARQEHIYDRVVNTSERTRDQIDFSQRYIAPFEGRVSAQARAIDLDPAWVYGLIRQESRFITDARSTVGASGLMQLMPGTAKWVAKKIGMTDFHPSRVNEFEVNTVLGTNYLNMVLQDLDGSQVLASAGYNAGPKRPVLWRSRLTHPVEGAIFAETIPFTETRIYVKNVLSNATYYAAMFTGEPQSLKARLGNIEPKANAAVDLP